MENNLYYYTDGACKGNPGPGGYAFVAVDTTHTKTLSWHASKVRVKTTNNRMEMRAIIAAMEDFNSEGYAKDYQMVIYSDSALICNSLNLKWYEKWRRNAWTNSKKKSVANIDLWHLLLPLYEKISPTVKHVKAHNGDKFNEMADKLASDAAK